MNTALRLFANEGYSATSTSKIAKDADVSEGLIFKHFQNKKGLLDAIIQEAEKKLNEVFAQIIFQSDPKEVIRMTIQQPFEIEESEHDFWRLQYKLKWEEEYYRPEKMKPLHDKLTSAFEELNYTEPENEASLLVQVLDTIAVGVLRDGKENQGQFKDFLLKKYGV